jgi:hypothetical protein
MHPVPAELLRIRPETIRCRSASLLLRRGPVRRMVDCSRLSPNIASLNEQRTRRRRRPRRSRSSSAKTPGDSTPAHSGTIGRPCTFSPLDSIQTSRFWLPRLLRDGTRCREDENEEHENPGDQLDAHRLYLARGRLAASSRRTASRVKPLDHTRLSARERPRSARGDRPPDRGERR